MSLADEQLYEVVEGPKFSTSWRQAIEDGLILEMTAGVLYAEIIDLLRWNPYHVKEIPGLPADVRRIKLRGHFCIWYSVNEQTVYLEEVTQDW